MNFARDEEAQNDTTGRLLPVLTALASMFAVSALRNRFFAIGQRVTDFAWTFPVYLVAYRLNRDPETQRAILDDTLRFFTPEHYPGGPRSVPLFTDLDLAERFCAGAPPDRPGTIIAMETPAAVKKLLERCGDGYADLAIDRSQETRIGASMEVRDAIADMERMGRI